MTLLTSDTFWQQIEKAKHETRNIQGFENYFSKEFQSWTFEECYTFQEYYEMYETAVIQHANNIIWSALYLINEGCVSDTYGFAGWLICQGKTAYFNVMLDAEYLAKLPIQKDKCNYQAIRFLAINEAKKKVKGNVKIQLETIRNSMATNNQYKVEMSNAKQEIKYGNLNRNRNWSIDEIKQQLPLLANFLKK